MYSGSTVWYGGDVPPRRAAGTERRMDGCRVREVEGGFALEVDGWAAGTWPTPALAWGVVDEVREERAAEAEAAAAEIAAEAAAERWFEERGYWAAAEQEDRERRAGVWP